MIWIKRAACLWSPFFQVVFELKPTRDWDISYLINQCTSLAYWWLSWWMKPLANGLIFDQETIEKQSPFTTSGFWRGLPKNRRDWCSCEQPCFKKSKSLEVYENYTNFCTRGKRDLGYEIQDGEKTVEEPLWTSEMLASCQMVEASWKPRVADQALHLAKVLIRGYSKYGVQAPFEPYSQTMLPKTKKIGKKRYVSLDVFLFRYVLRGVGVNLEQELQASIDKASSDMEVRSWWHNFGNEVMPGFTTTINNYKP